ncbi:MAG: DUF3995 domain-containing protein [Aureispira sp.]
MFFYNGVNFIVLCFLGGLHVYWALGGQWALKGVVPQTKENVGTFQPNFRATILVAMLLFAGALLHLEHWKVVSDFYRQIGLIVMGCLFLIRMIGDFNYVGIFKKQRDNLFARRDTLYYNPLCAVIGINALAASGIFF